MSIKQMWKAEGAAERNAMIAMRMINKNKPLEEIIEFTGLTKERLNELIKKVKEQKKEKK